MPKAWKNNEELLDALLAIAAESTAAMQRGECYDKKWDALLARRNKLHDEVLHRMERH